MDAIVPGADGPGQGRSDPTDARFVERALAVARLVLSIAAVAVIQFAPAGSFGGARSDALLFGYAGFAAVFLSVLLAVQTIPPWLPAVVQCVDLAIAAALSVS